MAFVEHPTAFDGDCIAIFEKEIILTKDSKLLSYNDLQNLESQFEFSDIFSENEFSICAAELKSKENLPQDYCVKTIRQFYAENDEENMFKVSRAKALLNWRKSTNFCSCCGSKLEYSKQFSAAECPQCKKIYFPRIEPCIIVLVNKGDKILLARHVQRNQDIYACIAGFMEAGESAEHAVAREIFEETGLRVKNIQYKGSQSWPFPSQLMLGFTAEYESGEITLQPEEIADAQWFDRENCPASPMPGSIAYKLIHNLI